MNILFLTLLEIVRAHTHDNLYVTLIKKPHLDLSIQKISTRSDSPAIEGNVFLDMSSTNVDHNTFLLNLFH